MANYPEIWTVKELKKFLEDVPESAMLYARNCSIAMAKEGEVWALGCLGHQDFMIDQVTIYRDSADELYMDY